MSLRLLGSYDSESENEEPSQSAVKSSHDAEITGDDTDYVTATDLPATTRVSHDTVRVGATEDERERSPLTACYGLDGGGEVIDSDSSESLSSDEQEEGCEKSSTVCERNFLPIPELDGSDTLTSSVFSNPYRQAEEAKLAVLRQHVDLSQSAEPDKERRKWPSKRGRRKRSQFQPSQFADSDSNNQCWNDRDSPAGPGGWKQGKHRSGLRGGLEPPKKFMKTHLKIQRQERPWTAK